MNDVQKRATTLINNHLLQHHQFGYVCVQPHYDTREDWENGCKWSAITEGGDWDLVEARQAHAAHVASVLAEAGVLTIADGEKYALAKDAADDADAAIEAAQAWKERAEKAEQYAKELERRFATINSYGERADLIAERDAAYQRGRIEGAWQVRAAVERAARQSVTIANVDDCLCAVRDAVAKIEKGVGA